MKIYFIQNKKKKLSFPCASSRRKSWRGEEEGGNDTQHNLQQGKEHMKRKETISLYNWTEVKIIYVPNI